MRSMKQLELPTTRHESKAPDYLLTSPKFKYVPALHTDIRKTFERLRQQKAPVLGLLS